MRSALYYPYITIESEEVLKTALLLWDELHVLAPDNHFPYSPHFDSEGLLTEAFEVIGRRHVPSGAEKALAHDLIEELLVRRELPRSFFFRATSLHDEHVAIFRIFTGKLMFRTWQMLREAGLAGPCSDSETSTNPFVGLTIMSILADCCAHCTFTRITDLGAAYASLQSVLADGQEQQSEIIKGELVPILVKTVDPKRLGLRRLIDFRKNENAASRELRHRLQKHLDEQAGIIAASKTPAERAEALRQFECDSHDDLKLLKEALKLNTLRSLGSKEIMTTMVASLGTAMLTGMDKMASIPEVATVGGGAVAIGGLIAAKSSFVWSRW